MCLCINFIKYFFKNCVGIFMINPYLPNYVFSVMSKDVASQNYIHEDDIEFI